MNEKYILLVEDNPEDVEFILLALRKNKIFHDIVVAKDGEEAIQYLFGEKQEGNSPEVVLLDLQMPKVHGMEVLRMIREDKRTCSLPVFVLTSSDELTDIIRSVELGSVKYLSKPLEFSEFVEVLGKITPHLTL
ncbi:response regulator [Rapidithrix thailandica]|uniref:Response regulator n=1 Tax=Rapidithrix thailandica TaxID=413964 RepID=A0AAW9S4R2_9BACT